MDDPQLLAALLDQPTALPARLLTTLIARNGETMHSLTWLAARPGLTVEHTRALLATPGAACHPVVWNAAAAAHAALLDEPDLVAFLRTVADRHPHPVARREALTTVLADLSARQHQWVGASGDVELLAAQASLTNPPGVRGDLLRAAIVAFERANEPPEHVAVWLADAWHSYRNERSLAAHTLAQTITSPFLASAIVSLAYGTGGPQWAHLRSVCGANEPSTERARPVEEAQAEVARWLTAVTADGEPVWDVALDLLNGQQPPDGVPNVDVAIAAMAAVNL